MIETADMRKSVVIQSIDQSINQLIERHLYSTISLVRIR